MRFIGQAASDLAEPVLEFVSKVEPSRGGRQLGGLPDLVSSEDAKRLKEQVR